MNTVCIWFDLDVKLLHLLTIFLRNVLQWTSCGSSVLCQGFQRIFVSPEPELQQKVIQQEKKVWRSNKEIHLDRKATDISCIKEKKKKCAKYLREK